MAIGSSGSVNTSSDVGGSFYVSVSWSETGTSVTNNTSSISITGTMGVNRVGDAFWVTGAGGFDIYWHDNNENSETWIAGMGIEELGYDNYSRSISGSISAKHKDDGTLSGYAIAKWRRDSNYGGYPPASATASAEEKTLTTIARASTPTTTPTSITIPASSGTITINTNRKSSTFTHTLTLKVGSTTIATYTGVGESKEINTADIDDAILATIPNANSATVDITCETFNGSTSIGTKTASFTANVGDGAKPTFANYTYADTNSTTTGITGNNQVMISGKSSLSVTISAANKAVANNSATMNKYTFAISGLSVEQAYSTSQIVKAVGTPTVAPEEIPSATRDLVVTAIDSRGLSTPVTKSITIVPYEAPIINASATRANGFEDTTTIKIAGKISRIVVGGTAKNTVNTSSGVRYRYKAQSTTTWGSWTNVTSSTDASTGTVSVTDFTLELDKQQAYDLEVRIIDRLTTSTASLTVSIGQPAFFIGDDGRVSVGEMPTRNKNTGENGLLEVAGRVYADGEIHAGGNAYANGNRLLEAALVLDLVYPVGSIYMTTTLTSASAVHDALGGTWEAWGGGRVPVGMGSNGTTNYQTVEATGGEEKHKLTVTEMPKHKHSVYISGNGGGSWTGVSGSPSNQWAGWNDAYVSEQGGDGSHNNMQPYITVYFWKRTA